MNFTIVARDDARDVRSVFAVVRENVGIFIRVVVSERNFLTVINVLYFKTFCGLSRLEVGKFYRAAFYVFNCKRVRTVGFCDDEFIFPALVIAGENAVAHIKTGIENGGYRSETRITACVSVNTGVFVDIDHVERVSRRIGHLNFDAIIGIGKRNRLHARGFLDLFQIAVNGIHRDGIQNGRILILHARYKSARLKRGNNRVLFFGDFGFLNYAGERFGVFRNRFRLGFSAVESFDERFAVDGYHDDHFVGVLVSAVFDKVLRFDLRHNLILREFIAVFDHVERGGRGRVVRHRGLRLRRRYYVTFSVRRERDADNGCRHTQCGDCRNNLDSHFYSFCFLPLFYVYVRSMQRICNETFPPRDCFRQVCNMNYNIYCINSHIILYYKNRGLSNG